jgi:acyl-CoA synthetase (AMP-forming)/AMP-acid ligase II
MRPIKYGQLFDQASAVAAGLIENGLEQGQTVAIMLPTGEEFFAAFFGILLAGGVAVPIYPPFRPDRLEEYAERQSLILRNAEVRVLITFQKAEGLLRLLRPRIPSLLTVTTVSSLSRSPARAGAESSSSDVALIQYTSGSTGNPKGVVLTQANLIANIRGIGQVVDVQPTDAGSAGCRSITTWD